MTAKHVASSWGVKVLLILGLLLMSLLHRSANAAQFLQWEDGSSFTTFGANESITIATGAINFIPNCPKAIEGDIEGTSDALFPTSDIYIVPSGTYTLGDDLMSADPSGVPNTVFGAGGGIFVEETIGFTKPGGTVGEGLWAVVYDECQNVKIDPEDFILDPAFRVHIPVNVPPLPSIAAFKTLSGGEAESWQKHLKEYQLVLKVLETYGYYACLTGGVTACLVDFLANQFVDKLKESFKATYLATLGIVVDPKEAALQHVGNLIQHYLGIQADPPDPNFLQLTPLGVREVIDPVNITDPLTLAIVDVGNVVRDEAALTQALLSSLERYQGAQVAGDGDWALIHARAARDYAQALAGQLPQTTASLDALKSAMLGDPRDLNAAGTALQALRDRINASGFSLDERRELGNIGLSDAQIEELRGRVVADNFNVTKESALTVLEEIQTTNAALVQNLGALVADMTVIVDTLAADPGIADSAPSVNAGGPYVGSEGLPITLDGSTSISPTSITLYEWDVDGDGAFDDATGVAPSFTFTREFQGIVGLRVTNAAGRTSVGYARIVVSSVNSRPRIDSFSPSPPNVSIITGTSQEFGVNVSDPDFDSVTIQWFVDGTLVTTGQTFFYHPIDPSLLGVHLVHALVTDNNPLGGSVAPQWAVTVLLPDTDGDGWHANVDCDDTDPGVNPGHNEVVGNGKDDDCNPATTDEGSPPTAFFNPLSGGRNVALLEAGASVQSVSSQLDFRHSPEAMLDFSSQEYNESPPGYPWASGSRQITNQWVKILLAGGNPYLIDRVKVMPRRCCEGQRVRDFQIAVSTTTADDAAFATVLTATAANTSTLQEFVLPRPVLARYIRYSPLNNRGDGCCVSTQQFKALTGQEGNQTVTFHNLSTDPDGDIASYLWDFGDGSPTSAEQSPSHTFPPGPGTYTVTLTVTDAVGQSHSTSLTQRVLVPPTASFTFTPTEPAEGQVITFSATMSDPDGGGTFATRWTFGDGSSPSIGNPVTHSFGDNGSFLVTLEVVDDDEQTTQVVRTVTPSNLPPTINAGPDREIGEDRALSFGMTIADPGSRDTYTCLFDFGDGGASGPGSCSFSHIYQDPGTYTLTATVTDDDGASATDSVLVSVFLVGAQNGYAATDFATGFNSGIIGPTGLAFDSADNLFVLNPSNGSLYKFGPSGGVADATTRVGAPGGIGLAFGKNGRLYNAGSGVREIDPLTGSVIRVVASVGCNGIAVDPLSGDIFVSGCGPIYRISDPPGGPVSVSLYAQSGGSSDGLAFGPDGTLYVALLSNNKVVKITGTNTATPGAVTFIADVPGGPDGIAVAASSDPGAPPFLVVNRGDGVITKIDLTTTPATLSAIYAGGTRGDFVVVGLDGCLYATQSDKVLKITNADGTCSLAPTTVPHLTLSPSAVSPSPTVGTSQTFTATLLDTSNPAGLPVTFTVTGTNPQTQVVPADAVGTAVFTYAGAQEGADTVVATTTVGPSALTSNPATVTWVAPPNTPPLVFNNGVTTNEDVAVAVFLNATDADGDSLTYAIVNGPTSGTLSGTPPNLLYTPNANSFGADSLTFTANDGQATSDPATVTITVTPINDPPILTVPGAQSVPEGQLLTFSVSASDVDGDPLSFSASGLPAGATFDPDTRAFSWTPDLTQSGAYVVTFSVSDGSVTDSERVAIAVTDVSPPTSLHASGGAYFLHDGYQEKLSLDVTVVSGDIQSGSWLKYYYTRTRMNLASTQVLSVEVVGNTATITGVATLNGVPGYGFIAQVTDGAPDAFGITIHRPDGTLHYSNAQSIVGGDLIIQ